MPQPGISDGSATTPAPVLAGTGPGSPGAPAMADPGVAGDPPKMAIFGGVRGDPENGQKWPFFGLRGPLSKAD